jgi:hypothetical protein
MRRLIILAAVAVAAIAGTATTAFAGSGGGGFTDGVYAGRAQYGSSCATQTVNCSDSTHGAYFTGSPDKLGDGNYTGSLTVQWSKSFVDTGAVNGQFTGETCAPVTGTMQFKVGSNVLRTALVPTANQGADGNSEMCFNGTAPVFYQYDLVLQVIGGTGTFSHVVKAGSTVYFDGGGGSPNGSMTSYLDQGQLGSVLVVHSGTNH